MFKEGRMSLADFHEQLQGYRRDIKQTWDAMSSVYEQFTEEAIHPDLCDYMRSSIRKMRVPVRSLHRLLDTPSHLPLTVVPYTFLPSITLRQEDELTDELMILILLFRRMCYPSPHNIDIHQQEILHKLYMLAQGYEDILQHIDRLLLRVLAQEKAEQQKVKSFMCSS